MSVSNRETEVNGNRVELWDCDDSGPVRRFAAALDRDASGFREIETSTVHDLHVWIDPGKHGAPVAVDIPDGFEVADVFVADGSVCVRVDEVTL